MEREDDFFEDLLVYLRSLVNTINQQFIGFTLEEKSDCINQLENGLSYILLVEDSYLFDDEGFEIGALIRSVVELLRCMSAVLEEVMVRPRGRPKLQIDDEDLLVAYRYDFTLKDTAQLLNCSTKTIQRRLSSIGLSRRGRYSDMSDVELDERVAEIQHDHPDRGYVFVEGTCTHV